MPAAREEERDGVSHDADAGGLDLLEGLDVGREQDGRLAKGDDRVDLVLHPHQDVGGKQGDGASHGVADEGDRELLLQELLGVVAVALGGQEQLVILGGLAGRAAGQVVLEGHGVVPLHPGEHDVLLLLRRLNQDEDVDEPDRRLDNRPLAVQPADLGEVGLGPQAAHGRQLVERLERSARRQVDAAGDRACRPSVQR